MKQLREKFLVMVASLALQFTNLALFCGEKEEVKNDAYTTLLSIASNKEYEKISALYAKYDRVLDEKDAFMATFDIKSLPANGFYVNISAALEKIGFFKTIQQMADCDNNKNPKFWENKDFYRNNDKLYSILAIIGLYRHILDYKVICLIEKEEYDDAAKLLTGYFNSFYFFSDQPKIQLVLFCGYLDKKYGNVDANLSSAINRILTYDKEYHQNNSEKAGNSTAIND